MTTQAISRRRKPRGRYPKTQEGATPKRQKRIPEYLEADEVNAIIRAAPNPKAKLLMLEQWRAGLRVSEALDLEVRDLSLDTPNPTVRVRSGNGGKSRLVPVHPELHGALGSALVPSPRDTGTSIRNELNSGTSYSEDVAEYDRKQVQS